MLKKFKPASLLPLGFAAAAAVAIIIACGNGEIITLDADKIADSRYNLENLIDHMDGDSSNSGGESSPSDGGSSSSVGSSSSGGYSSSSGGSDGESSNSGGDYSSSGGNSSSSSSSAAPPSEVTCPSGSPEVSGATCTWTPSTVISGDIARVSTSAEEGCASKVFATVSGSLGRIYVAYFDIESDITTAGKKQTYLSGTVQATEWTWPASGNAGIKSIITCENKCKVVPCELTINKAPDPVVPSNKSVKFDNRDYSSSSKLYYYKGTKPKITSTATQISNNADAKCTKIRLEITAGTYNQSKEVDIPENGSISLDTYTAADGLPDVSAETEITAKVIATCRGGSEHELATATATLVPDPILTGDCTWSKNPTSLAQGAKPSGVSLQYSYGRCGNGTSDGALPTTAYGGDGVAQWPTNGIDNLAVKTYSSVKTTVNCTPAVTQKSCPSLQVNKGCSVVINSFNAVATVPKGECFDVKYTATGNEPSRDNGMFVQCTKLSSGNQSDNCMGILQYGSQLGFKSFKCDQTGTNATSYFLISGSQKFASGKVFDLEGVTPNIYKGLNESDYLDYQCVSSWDNAVWTSQCNGATLITLKSGVTFPATSDFDSSCKLKTDNGNNW